MARHGQGHGGAVRAAARVVAGLLATVGLATAAAAPAAAEGEAPPWTWPLDGAGPASVTRGFDPPEERWAAGHRGVDLAGAPGAPVRAAAAGRVSFAGLLAGRGVVVVVHGDLRSTYEPVAAAVAVGAVVGAGEVLGALVPGHAGCPAAACLHWGLKRAEAYLDPLPLLARGPVRLLPLRGVRPDVEAPELTPASPARPVPPPPVAEPSPAGPPAPPAEPTTSLRSAVAPAGSVGAVGLLALLALLQRRRSGRPRGPDPAPSAAARERPAPASAVRPLPAPVVDLARERAVRRAA